jgi:hypothetical protein
MSKLWVLGIAFLLLLAAFPLISFGTTGDNETLWWIGLALLVVGSLVAPVTRYVFPDEDEEKEEGDKEQEEEKEEEGRHRGREAETEPADIRVIRGDDVEQNGDHATTASGDSPQRSPEEHRARAHEQRAEAHRERAKSHEELARAEEQRAEAADESGAGREQEQRRPGNDGNSKP